MASNIPIVSPAIANSVPVAPLYANSVPNAPQGGGGRRVAVFGGILVLMLIAVGIYLMQRSSTTSVPRLKKRVSRLTPKAAEKEQSVLAAMVDKQGLTIEEAKAERDAIVNLVNENAGGECIFSHPMAGGTCPRNFSLDTDLGCCMPEGSPMPSTADVMRDLALDLVKSIIIDELIEELILRSIQLLQRLLMAKLIALAIKTGSKMLMKLATMAMAGPVGWALMAFDMLSMALDFLDPKGYDMFSANSVLQRKAEIGAYTQWTYTSLDKRSWPVMISMEQIWPTVYENFITPALMEKYELPAFALLLDEYGSRETLSALVEAADGSFGKAFEPHMDAVQGKNPAERDELIISALRDGINENEQEDVMLIPAMSLPDRIGITITQKKCEKWNKQNLPAWLQFLNNLTGTETNKYVSKTGKLVPNEDADGNPLPPAPFANWTDWCYVPDEERMITETWSEGEPPMKKVKLKDLKEVKANNPSGADVWCALDSSEMSSCFAMCTGKKERESDLGKEDFVSDPSKFGVHWKNGECIYTKKYCESVNLEFKNNDCKMYAGQGAAEAIFGATITREFVDWGNDIGECATKPSLGACTNAIAGPVLKNYSKMVSETGKNIGGCFEGNAVDCGQILTDGPTAVPGKLLSGFGHGLAGMSALGGDYTAALTASFTFVGDVGDMIADPLDALMHPAATAGALMRGPLMVWDGAAAAISHIPVIGGPVASVITGITGLGYQAIDNALDVEDMSLANNWYCPHCLLAKVAWAGFRAIFKVGDAPKKPEDWARELKASCKADRDTCRMKWGGNLNTQGGVYCAAMDGYCEKITMSNYKTAKWGKPDVEENRGDEYIFDENDPRG
jgi:hypothetical protein